MVRPLEVVEAQARDLMPDELLAAQQHDDAGPGLCEG